MKFDPKCKRKNIDVKITPTTNKHIIAPAKMWSQFHQQSKLNRSTTPVLSHSSHALVHQEEDVSKKRIVFCNLPYIYYTKQNPINK